MRGKGVEGEEGKASHLREKVGQPERGGVRKWGARARVASGETGCGQTKKGGEAGRSHLWKEKNSRGIT